MVAMLFIVFDIEVLFIYPWAVLFWDLKWYGMVQIGIFTLLLVESYVYIRKKGALEWE
jgi:NADH-quinone oxidoreductase subunit A